MEAAHIEYISLSTSKLPSEVDKHVKVNSSSNVMLSCNDALRSQACKEVVNCPFVKVATLRVGNEKVSGIAVKRHVSQSDRLKFTL